MNFHSIPRAPSGLVDVLLAGYAAGAVSRPMHVLVASHLALKPANRAFVAALEVLSADGMASHGVAEGPSDPIADRDARLAAICSGHDIADPAKADPAAIADRSGLLPGPLASFTGLRIEDMPWRGVLPGLKEVRFQHQPGCEASMFWIKAGRAVPSHTHAGMEATLVLKGAFADSAGRYERGDIAVADSEIDHQPIADAEEGCICFAVTEGPRRLTGPIGRLFQMLMRQ